MASSHLDVAHGEWNALQSKLNSAETITINGRDLSIADVIAVAQHGAKVKLTSDPSVLKLVSDSCTFLAQQLADGRVIYGVNTGFGGSADTRTQYFELLQSAAIQHLNVGILLPSDKGQESPMQSDLLRSHALPAPIVRATMLVRCNSLMRGHSAVRVGVIEAIVRMLELNMTPVVPLRGSISASGDLSTLSYIAGAIEGNPDIYVRIDGKGGSRSKCVPANVALNIAGISPVRLQAKEGLGITNGTAPSCATASIAMHQANQLAILVQVLTAMGTEALTGTAHNYDPFVAAVRPHKGQTEAAANILKYLSGSKISADRDPERIGLAQDRYALRTAPQWIGPQLEDLLLATSQVAVELNSTTDNPLIDVAGQRIHHCGNFQAASVTSAMEKTLTALQNLGRLLYAQSSELINNSTNKGLPPNLSADDPSLSFTCKGFDVNMAAYMAELAYLAHPVSGHVQVAEMANQSVNSMALVSARYALEAVEVLSLMAATYIYTLCQALDLRCMQLEFRRIARRYVDEAVTNAFGALQVRNDAGEVLFNLVDKAVETLLGKWDLLSHLDNVDRGKAAARDALGSFLEHVSYQSPGIATIQMYQEQVAAGLSAAYEEVRRKFFENQTTPEYVSPASRIVYNLVRKDLGIPLNRGVVDHPTLQLEELEPRLKVNGATHEGTNGVSNANGATHDGTNGVNGATHEGTNGVSNANGDHGRSNRRRILGTMASEIYLAIRNGEVHSRIMKFYEEADGKTN